MKQEEKVGVNSPIRFGFRSKRIVNFIKRLKVSRSFGDLNFKLELLFRPQDLDPK